MTEKERKSCIRTIELLRRLAYNIHGVMDVIDAENCDKIISMLEQEQYYKDLANSYEKTINKLTKAISEQEPKTYILDKINNDIQTLRGCSCSCSDGIIDDVEDIIYKYRQEG